MNRDVMLPAHTLTLCQARSHVAALADSAATIEASISYDQILLQIDALYADDDIPAIAPLAEHSRKVLFAVAESAIEDLAGHGLDALTIELVLDMLHTARDLDGP